LPNVHGNARQLEDLWTNLLLWARAAVDDEQPHTIRIGAKATPAGGVVARLTDGECLWPASLPAGGAEDPAAPSTGLELGICREVMRQHGGALELVYLPTAGKLVTLTFPASN
jgi:hypothetical protein